MKPSLKKIPLATQMRNLDSLERVSSFSRIVWKGKSSRRLTCQMSMRYAVCLKLITFRLYFPMQDILWFGQWPLRNRVTLHSMYLKKMISRRTKTIHMRTNFCISKLLWSFCWPGVSSWSTHSKSRFLPSDNKNKMALTSGKRRKVKISQKHMLEPSWFDFRFCY